MVMAGVTESTRLFTRENWAPATWVKIGEALIQHMLCKQESGLAEILSRLPQYTSFACGCFAPTPGQRDLISGVTILFIYIYMRHMRQRDLISGVIILFIIYFGQRN